MVTIPGMISHASNNDMAYTLVSNLIELLKFNASNNMGRHLAVM